MSRAGDTAGQGDAGRGGPEPSGEVRWARPGLGGQRCVRSRAGSLRSGRRVWEAGLGGGLGLPPALVCGLTEFRGSCDRFPESGVRGRVGARRRKRPRSERNCEASEPRPLLWGLTADQVHEPQEGGWPQHLEPQARWVEDGPVLQSPWQGRTGRLSGQKDGRPERGRQPEPAPESQVSGFCPRFPGDGGRPTEKHLGESERGLRCGRDSGHAPCVLLPRHPPCGSRSWTWGLA